MKTILGLIVVCSLALASSGQTALIPWPPAPKTQIEAFETRINTVIVKGTAELGIVTGTAGAVIVVCKESTDTTTKEKAFGAAVIVRCRGCKDDGSLLDYDELDSAIQAIDKMSAAQWSETSLPQVEATYNSKDGLRIASFSNKATGTLEAVIQSTHSGQATALLNIAQLTALRNLLDQAKGKIETIRASK